MWRNDNKTHNINDANLLSFMAHLIVPSFYRSIGKPQHQQQCQQRRQ